MNPKHKELAEEVITFFKESGKTNLIPAKDLSELITDIEVVRSVIYALVDLGLMERSLNHSFRLTAKGWRFTNFSDLEKEELDKKIKEQLEFRKTQIDLELSEKILKEYPKTKWFARIGLVIAILLALKELYIWLMQ